MNAYVMNLIHRVDRWDKMKSIFGNLNLIRVNGEIGTDLKSKVKALGLSHMRLIKECVEKGMKTVLILEDDCIAESGWFNRWVSIKEYLDNNLDKWEVFNGCIYNLVDKEYVMSIGDTALLKGSIGGASHWVYLNLNAYEKFMTWVDEDIDLFYNDGKKFKVLCSYPFIALQESGFSDLMNQERKWDYLRYKMEYQIVVNSRNDNVL